VHITLWGNVLTLFPLTNFPLLRALYTTIRMSTLAESQNADDIKTLLKFC
jgi:hypothetical protein